MWSITVLNFLVGNALFYSLSQLLNFKYENQIKSPKKNSDDIVTIAPCRQLTISWIDCLTYYFFYTIATCRREVCSFLGFSQVSPEKGKNKSIIPGGNFVTWGHAISDLGVLFKAGLSYPRVIAKFLISDMKAWEAISILFFLPAIWWLEALKRREKITQENAFEQKKKKPQLKFNPRLALISLQTTGPWIINSPFRL